ncbi:MAG: hypothetical protein L3K18_06435 [Thermoplasmata archaeon]|nr:hypothetical protein [Thermoplasmata archaeon]MCI4356760.1 hypothetical protein [Thermoplasmata archaeon]
MATPSPSSERVTPTAATPDTLAALAGLLLLVDFVVAVVMLATDKNLQTNFGASSPYYVHWYGVLGIAVVTLIGGLAVLSSASPSMAARMPRVRPSMMLFAALGWSVLVVLAMVGIVESYSQVGFPSANEFGKYLFGTSAYPGALSYIPWLYDAMLALFVLTAIVAAAAAWRARKMAPAA